MVSGGALVAVVAQRAREGFIDTSEGRIAVVSGTRVLVVTQQGRTGYALPRLARIVGGTHVPIVAGKGVVRVDTAAGRVA